MIGGAEVSVRREELERIGPKATQHTNAIVADAPAKMAIFVRPQLLLFAKRLRASDTTPSPGRPGLYDLGIAAAATAAVKRRQAPTLAVQIAKATSNNKLSRTA